MKFQQQPRWVGYLYLSRFACLGIVLGLASAPNMNAQNPTQSLERSSPQDSRQGPAVQKMVTVTSRSSHEANDPDFIIGASDVLAISVWKEPEITRTVTVRRDGKIGVPLVGEVVASGLTTKQLQAIITQKLAGFLSSPEVTVIVQEAKSQTVTVIGQVLKPGSYDLSKPMKVLDALALAGGFQDFAKVSKIYVLRLAPNGAVSRANFNYKKVIKGHDLSKNIELEPHDTIVVP